MADLITLQRALDALPSDITAGQEATVPTLITAASRQCERYCNRHFTAGDYDEIRTPLPAPQFTAQADMVELCQFPVNSVARVSGGRTSAILIGNTATTTNQRAQAEIVMTGDPEVQLTGVSLKLTRIASATSSTNTLTFASYPTLATLAAAVNALGNGWTATVQNSLGSWASSDLVSREGPLGAITPGGCYFDIFSYDHVILDVDRKAGVVYFSGYNSTGAVGVNPWGGSLLGADEDISWGFYRPQVRVAYNAGWSTIPDDVQQACVLIVQAMFASQTTDPRFSEIRLDQKSVKLATLNAGIPASAAQLLSPYRVRIA